MDTWWVFVYMAAAFGLLVFTALRRSDTVFRKYERKVIEPPELWLQRLTLQLSGLRHHEFEYVSPTSVRIRVLRRPAWSVWVAVLGFPIGLLALLVTTTDTGLVVVTPNDSGSVVHARGRFTLRGLQQLERALQAAQPPATPPNGGVGSEGDR